MEAGAEQPSQPPVRSWPPPSPLRPYPGGGWKRQTPALSLHDPLRRSFDPGSDKLTFRYAQPVDHTAPNEHATDREPFKEDSSVWEFPKVRGP